MNQTQIDNIPEAMKILPRWLCMKLVQKPDQAKLSKVPIDPKTGKNGSSTDRTTHGTFEQALERFVRDNLSGIGFALGDGFTGVDMDHVIHDGVVSPEALKIVEMLDSYTEKSFSGEGIHVYGVGMKPAGVTKCKMVNFDSNGGDLEIYDSGRYFVVTGDALSSREFRKFEESLADVVSEFMPDAIGTVGKSISRVPIESIVSSISDDEVIRRASNGRFGQEFKDQLSGLNPIKNGDLSGNDLSFCNKLARETRDVQQIDRIVRRGRNRSKLDEVHFSSGATYLEHTIMLALDRTAALWAPSADAVVEAVVPEKASEALALNSAQDGAIEIMDIAESSFNDLDLASIFQDYFGDRLIHTPGSGWLGWSGKTWDPGEHHAYSTAIEFMDAIWHHGVRLVEEATTPGERTIASHFLGEAVKLRSKTRIDALVGLAKHKLFMPDEVLDAAPLLLNTPDGIVDLLTSSVRDVRPEDFVTQITACGIYSDEAARTLWKKFLHEVTDGDENFQNFLQVYCGQFIIGEVYDENIGLAVGPGSAGKSTLFNPIFRVIGSYATGVDPNILLISKQNMDPSMMALFHKRFVLASETEQGRVISSAQLKKLASTDPVTGRRLYHDQATFKPTHTMLLYTNHLPKVGSTDTGTWRRIVVLPFKHVYDRKDAANIRNYGNHLFKNAGSAILGWLIEGARLYLAAGGRLPACKVVESAVEAYRGNEDSLSLFLDEYCVTGPEYRIGSQALYDKYHFWAVQNSEYVLRQVEFSDAMQMKGFKKIAPQNRKTWLGLRLNSSYHFMDNTPMVDDNPSPGLF
jgi:putative DNA primase/helicase